MLWDRCSGCARAAICRSPRSDSAPTSIPSRPAASMTACSARWPRSRSSGRSTTPESKPKPRSASSTGPMRKVLVSHRRPWLPPLTPAITPPKTSSLEPMQRASASAKRSTASAIAAQSRLGRESSAPLSNCISSRGRCWKPRTRPSAWSIAAKASSGMTARSPASKVTPAPPRCRFAATRWRRYLNSCWRSNVSPRPTRTRSAQWAKR